MQKFTAAIVEVFRRLTNETAIGRAGAEGCSQQAAVDAVNQAYFNALREVGCESQNDCIVTRWAYECFESNHGFAADRSRSETVFAVAEMDKIPGRVALTFGDAI